jgi:hypothetical protein
VRRATVGAFRDLAQESGIREIMAGMEPTVRPSPHRDRLSEERRVLAQALGLESAAGDRDFP